MMIAPPSPVLIKIGKGQMPGPHGWHSGGGQTSSCVSVCVCACGVSAPDNQAPGSLSSSSHGPGTLITGPRTCDPITLRHLVLRPFCVPTTQLAASRVEAEVRGRSPRCQSALCASVTWLRQGHPHGEAAHWEVAQLPGIQLLQLKAELAPCVRVLAGGLANSHFPSSFSSQKHMPRAGI